MGKGVSSLTEHEPSNNLVSTRETKFCLEGGNTGTCNDHGENDESNLNMLVST